MTPSNQKFQAPKLTEPTPLTHGLPRSFELSAPADEHATEGHGAATPAETHRAEPHGEEKKEGMHLPEEFPNFYTLGSALVGYHPKHHAGGLGGPFGQHGPWFLNPLFSFFYAAVFVLLIRRAFRRRSLEKPSKAQVAVEAIFSGLYNFFGSVLGEKHARKYVPFVGSLWLFILLNNLFGLIPLFKAPSATFWTTIGLGVCVFAYVNYNGIKEGGIGHYFWHLCGSPQGLVGWFVAPILFPLELIGTFVKPISLALRLAGNIFGEDRLLAAFMGFGVIIAGFLARTDHPPFGIPLHTPFLFLAFLTSFIQATVFAMLSAVYISMVLPHEHHEHIEEEDHEEGTDPIVA